MKFIRTKTISEPLILEPEDWSEAEWAVILNLFGMEEAERIVIRDYVLEAFGNVKKERKFDYKD